MVLLWSQGCRGVSMGKKLLCRYLVVEPEDSGARLLLQAFQLSVAQCTVHAQVRACCCACWAAMGGWMGHKPSLLLWRSWASPQADRP
jgi:hypothetical protein